jgi:hypothetical protein
MVEKIIDLSTYVELEHLQIPGLAIASLLDSWEVESTRRINNV